MTVKERLEDAADRLDDLELSELLRETIDEIERIEAESLDYEQHADRVEAELVTMTRLKRISAKRADRLHAQLARNGLVPDGLGEVVAAESAA